MVFLIHYCHAHHPTHQNNKQFAVALPSAFDPVAFPTMWIMYGPLDDLSPIKHMAYAHMDLTHAVPVMNTIPAPKLLLRNVSVVVRRTPPTPEEVEADAAFFAKAEEALITAATAAAAAAEAAAAVEAEEAEPVAVADPAEAVGGGAVAAPVVPALGVVPAAAAAKDVVAAAEAEAEAPEIAVEEEVEEEPVRVPVVATAPANSAAGGDQRVVALPITEVRVYPCVKA